MDLIGEVFGFLKQERCVTGGREFSVRWLGRSPSYLSSMKARSGSRQISTDVLLTLYVRLREYTEANDILEDSQDWDALIERLWSEAMDRIN
jgi:hypothetical protein